MKDKNSKRCLLNFVVFFVRGDFVGGWMGRRGLSTTGVVDVLLWALCSSGKMVGLEVDVTILSTYTRL